MQHLSFIITLLFHGSTERGLAQVQILCPSPKQSMLPMHRIKLFNSKIPLSNLSGRFYFKEVFFSP